MITTNLSTNFCPRNCASHRIGDSAQNDLLASDESDHSGSHSNGLREVNSVDKDELLFIIPDHVQTPKNRLQYTNSTSVPIQSWGVKRATINMLDRLMWTQNIWCLPNLSRKEAEDLLRKAAPGNFILRVNRTNCAMVLSRRVLASTALAPGTVQHNTIEVIPRSGYCLTSDKHMRLIFGSLVQLLHFYLRISREYSTVGGPFLQLPRPIMEAPTLEAMEQLNRMGKSFWRINVGKSAGPQTQHSTRNLTNTSRCSPRTASADRWLNVQNQSPVNDQPNADRLRSRPRDPRTSTKNHTIFRGRACSLGGSIVDRERGSSSDKITNGSSYSKLPYSGFQSVSSSPRPQHDVTKCSGEWLTPQRTTVTQNGVYEDQQSEFWRSLKSNSNDDSNVAHRQGGNCVNLTYNSSDSSGTRSRHLDLPHYEREAEEERCKLWPTPPPYSPSVLTVNSLRNSDLQSQDYNGHGIDRAGGGKENTKRPILATLDEHLKSLEKQDQKENAIQERSPLKLHGKKAVNHQAPCWRKTTHDKWLLEQRVQTNGGFVNSEPSNSVTASETKCIEKGVVVTINDSYNAKIHNGLQTSDHPAIQLPSPKAVGKVFVMEAATYSNDDYELLSESMSGPRPHLAPMFDSFQRLGAKEEWPTERETSQSGCINEVSLVGSCRLRRAHTTRDSCRKAVPETDSAERDGEDVKRRYAVFLDDVNGWRKSSEEIGSRNPGLNDEFLNDSNPPGKLWRTNPVLHLSDKESIPVVDPSASQPSSLPSIGTRAYRQKLVNLEAKQLPWHVDHIHDSVGDALAVKDQPLSNPGSTLLAPSRHPPSTVSSSAVSEPPIPRSRRTLASASIRSTQSEKQDVNTDPSPSTSSRASTVFCTPWDAPPTGVYLSDLIQLTGGGVANAHRRDPFSHLRRRTLSSLDHRLFSERPASIGDLGQHNSKLEFQRLLWLWMQHNTVTDGKPTPMQPRNQGGSEDPTTNGPPPVPQRRPRLKHLQTSLSTTATPRSARSDESADINPYAVVTCSTDATPDDDSFAGSGKATSKQLLQDVKVLNADEGEPTGVYDDTFVEHADGPIGKVNLVQLDAAPSSKCGAFPDGSNTLVGTGDGSAPRNYVYAKVLPRNLRNRVHPLPSPSSTKQLSCTATDAQRNEFVSHPKAVLVHDGFNSFRDHSDSSSNELFMPSDYSPLPAAVRRPNKRSASYYRSRPLSTSLSLSSLSSKSRSPSPTTTYSTPWSKFSPISVRDTRHKCVETKNHHAFNPGHYIRRFVNCLMREKSSPLANQINLFLECTRNSVNQGPYRTMQSVRQFISGITNYLLQNPKLGLPSAIELEKRQLSDFGFVNVGALLESSLQKYVLRPLHRHIIRQLRQEQIRHNELGPLQNTVQLLGATSPQEFGIPSSLRVPTEPLLQRVRALFRQVQSTYSVSRKMSHLVHLFDLIRDEVMIHGESTQLSPQDLQLVYVWTFARAGLLLSPSNGTTFVPSCVSQTTRPSTEVFCPAALQADYLDGLLTKTQLHNQAVGQRCLNDLFATLYVAWTRSSTRCNSSSELLAGVPYLASSECGSSRFTQGSLDGVISPTPASPRVPTASKNSVEDVTSSGGLNNFHTSFKRRILPPRRRKTITALISPKDLQSHSPLASTKWYAPSSSASATNPEHPRAPNSKLDPEQSDPLRNPSLFTRWRPWVPNHPNSSTCSPVLDQPMLRVMAVDERAGHLRNQLYPARPSLTAGELCNMLAFEMKIFDPKEFGLFAHREGKEVLLDDHIHLIDFIETSNHGSNQIFGNQRSPTVFTANSTRHPLRLVNKTVQRSLSSRSNSPPSSSSSGSYSHGIKKPERSNSFSVARWLMRKRNGVDVGGVVVPANELRSVRSQLKPTTSADALGLLPSTPHQTMGGEPVLIYKRITGVFAISERAFSDHRYKLQSSPQKQMSPCSGKL